MYSKASIWKHELKVGMIVSQNVTIYRASLATGEFLLQYGKS